MAKLKMIYVCSECGATSPRWEGQCRACNAWNSFVEDVVDTSPSGTSAVKSAARILTTATVETLAARPIVRTTTGIGEFDRVVGGGVVPGSLILLGGEPGIGKSTLTLQLAHIFAETVGTVIIASGEESAEQIALRAKRTGLVSARLAIVGTTDIDAIIATAENEKPALLIVDSVQVMTSGAATSLAGTIPQIRLVAEQLMRFAKVSGTPVILIGHVTKEGELAGPRVLEHLVDVVLTLEGDRYRDMRLLRTQKNRFGATSEVGVFEMGEAGLIEIANPSAAFLTGRADNPIGSIITATMEGTRPLLVEVQALTASTNFGYPKRTASGFDLNRLNILIAVLARHADLRLESSDVFVNIVGGMRLTEPAADLAVCLAIASSKLKKAAPRELAAWGEVGLSGEVRHATQHDTRAREATKMGLKKIADGKRIDEIIAQLFGK